MDFKEKIEWASRQFFAREMMDCHQNSKYHAEGSVWEHTMMVCEQLLRIPEYQKLSGDDREAVELAVIFHDVGKPSTTTIDENGQIISPHHCSAGAMLSRRFMEDAGVPFLIRETACNLIRWHMKPLYIGEAEDVAYHVIFTSCLCRNDLLYILSKADNAGRISICPQDTQWIDLWKEECERFNCFYSPYKFQNEHARLMFYLKKTFQPYYKPFMNEMFDIYMLCGLPGTGKTWWAKNKLSQYPLVELDMAREELGVKPLEEEGRVFQMTKEMCRKHMRERKPFVFSAVNYLKTSRQRWSSLFIGYGAKVNIIYLEKPLSVVFRQNKERKHPVPENIILSMRSRLEIPNWDECHNLELCYNEK